MSEGAPENGPTLDDLKKAFREATLEGMKDYDRERSEWEAAEAAQQKVQQDTKPPQTGGGLGALLLGGRKAVSS